ncbi:hypothetical protein MNEG_12797 [Monoraphidium neglectum]|uniref:Uncharacterized protein n=1 Tax=Monoraphidium neglectum TaxID=145388 RepID=A0A0D2M148_9CHLO|nr:hypothetical protein MNEG_12797 [Monoraphidium neglectum]KIY95166.1 hypothetical protein MNEG_12797 [Monoraphidium neglectum]|eukprot:XP_013894186.1 hypothetical protein MNEG_12797 [Monoraphidium neglectum]
MDGNLTAFEDILGTCERLLRTPIPLSYTRHTSRFLVIWLALLPFTLFGSLGLATPPLCLMIAFLLLGIEEIGVSIEEPFSILALEAVCDSATNNVRELQAQYTGDDVTGDDVTSGQASAQPRPRRPVAAALMVAIGAADDSLNSVTDVTVQARTRNLRVRSSASRMP